MNHADDRAGAPGMGTALVVDEVVAAVAVALTAVVAVAVVVAVRGPGMRAVLATRDALVLTEDDRARTGRLRYRTRDRRC
jgi:hypothetical protein